MGGRIHDAKHWDATSRTVPSELHGIVEFINV